jgi:hypothetical protein
MAARRGKAGLTDDEVAALKTQLAGGGRPRVLVSGPQFPAGSAGTVVSVGDPTLDGADYVRVRVKVNGMTDELSFAPAELSLRRSGKQPAAAPERPRRAPRKTAPATENTPSVAGHPAPQPIPTQPVSSRPGPAQPVAPAAPASRRRKPSVLPKVSFTVTSAGASWSVSAVRGAKGIAKNLPVSPGTVTALAELLGQPALAEAVAEINETALAEAQVRADQLRAELADLEAVLATHRSPT